ncbi:MAG: hypothetical protein ABH864_04415 [archaeon]
MVEKTTEREEIEKIPVKIIDEGRKEGKQLSIRFPKRVTEALEIDPERDMFLFKFDKNKLHLEGELVDKRELKND